MHSTGFEAPCPRGALEGPRAAQGNPWGPAPKEPLGPWPPETPKIPWGPAPKEPHAHGGPLKPQGASWSLAPGPCPWSLPWPWNLVVLGPNPWPGPWPCRAWSLALVSGFWPLVPSPWCPWSLGLDLVAWAWQERPHTSFYCEAITANHPPSVWPCTHLHVLPGLGLGLDLACVALIPETITPNPHLHMPKM